MKKVYNASGKIVHIGKVTLFPAETKEITDDWAINPVVLHYLRIGVLLEPTEILLDPGKESKDQKPVIGEIKLEELLALAGGFERDQLMEHLDKMGIEYDPKANKATLIATLRKHIESLAGESDDGDPGGV